LTLSLDGKVHFKLLLRSGPESDGVEFGQSFIFSKLLAELQRPSLSRYRSMTYISPRLKQIYETSVSPVGLSWKFTFHNNHGDDYYIGLDHMDFFDPENQLLDMEKLGAIVTAVPYSVQDLSSSANDSLANDPRSPEQLFNSNYFADSPQKTCWLSPVSRCMTTTEREACVDRLSRNYPKDLYQKRKRASLLPKENTLWILFPYPVAIGAIR
jgi:hypothetical protein